MTRPRDRAGGGLLRAVPDRHRRGSRVRGRRKPVHVRRRRRRLALHGTGASSATRRTPAGTPRAGWARPSRRPRPRAGGCARRTCAPRATRPGSNGTLIRIDPANGAGVPGNPGFSSADPNERRILAYGLRNPYGLAIRPGTNDVWIADRGHGYWSELDRVPNPADPVRNFGWPCYEGGLDENGNPYARIRPRSDDFDLDICENLYAEGTATAAPYWAYDHELPGRAGRGLPRERTGRADQHLSQRARVLPAGRRLLPGRLPGRAVLQRPLARLHLGDAARPRRPARSGQRGEVRAASGVPARPRGGSRRRSLLRRQRDRGREALPLLAQRIEPGAERGRAGGSALPATGRSRSTSTAPARATRMPGTCSPTHGTSTATARPTTRPRSSRAAPTPRRAATRSHCGSPTPPAPRPPTRSRWRSQSRPGGLDRHAGRRHDVEGG